jgi:maltoporin
MSGFGAGVKNIDLGIGKLWVAYLGGLDDDIASPDTGSFYKHSLDIRLKDIQIGPGKLMLVLIGNYEKGTTFTKDFNGNLLAAGGAILTHPVRTDGAYGIGGGAAYHIDLNAIGPKSYLEVYGLAGWGATNFSTSTDLGVLTGFVNSALVKNPATPASAVINAPTIKPKGGFFTRPELRVFASYAIWSDSLRGSTTSVQEGSNTGGFSPAPYAKSNDGWLLGTQVEWYF